MKAMNKPYPYYDAPEINSLRELVDYCTKTHSEKVAFHWLKKNLKKPKIVNLL